MPVFVDTPLIHIKPHLRHTIVLEVQLLFKCDEKLQKFGTNVILKKHEQVTVRCIVQSKYEQDFYGWLTETVSLLKDKKFEELDLPHLIEEIEDMGKSEKRSFASRLSQLIAHLLKWQYQPGLRSNSWKFTIKGQRKHLADLLIENPSFKSMIDAFIAKGYEYSVNIFRSETNLDIELPTQCPYSFEQLFDDNFFP